MQIFCCGITDRMLYVSVICLPSPPSRKRHSTCALLERCVYGGQAPDAREERALSNFLWKLIRSRPKHTLLQNLKRRYRRI
mgnify:FL=1|jgi:hypothetical protein